MVGIAMFFVALVMALLNMPGVMEGKTVSICGVIFCGACAVVNLVIGVITLIKE